MGRKDRGCKEGEGENGQAELLPSTDGDYFLKNISVLKIHHYTQKN